MKFEYLIEEISGTDEKQLSDLGDGGWEAVTSWVLPPDTHVNPGKPRVYILFKQAK